MVRRVLVVALATVMSLVLAVPAFAAPPEGKGPKGGKSDSSIVLNQTGPIHHGDTVTFTVSTSDTDRPFVKVECFQDGDLVYSNTVGIFQEWYDLWGEPVVVLSSLAWDSGDADCDADLQYQDKRGRLRTPASMSFAVLGA